MKRVLTILGLATVALGAAAVLWLAQPEAEEITGDTGDGPVILVLSIQAAAGVRVEDGTLVGSQDNVAALLAALQESGAVAIDRNSSSRRYYYIRVSFPAGTDVEEVRGRLRHLPFFVGLEEYGDRVEGAGLQ